jgi:transposase
MTLETSIANHYTTDAVVNYYVKIKNDGRPNCTRTKNLTSKTYQPSSSPKTWKNRPYSYLHYHLE